MTWDAEQRRYEDDEGRPIPPAEIRKQVDKYVKDEQEDVSREAKRLIAGLITVAVFFEFMRQKVQMWHEVTGQIAYGGSAQMTDDRWARVEDKIASELDYLAGFEQQVTQSFAIAERVAADVAQTKGIPAGLDSVVEENVRAALLDAAPSEAQQVVKIAVEESLADSIGESATVIADEAASSITMSVVEDLIGGRVVSISEMYPNAAYATYANNELLREKDEGVERARRTCEEDQNSCAGCLAAASDEWMPIDDVPPIGEQECMANDRCVIEYDVGRDDQALEGGISQVVN